MLKAFNDSSIRTKLRLSFGALLAAVLVFGLLMTAALNRVQRAQVEVQEGFDLLRGLAALESNSYALRDAVGAYLLSGESKWEEVYDEASGQIDYLLAELPALIEDEQEQAKLAQFVTLSQALQAKELVIIARVREGQGAIAQELFQSAYESTQTEVSLLLAEMSEGVRNNVKHLLYQNSRLLNFTQLAFIALMISLATIAVIISTAATEKLTGMIEGVLAAAKEISQGNLKKRVKVETKDEIGRMAIQFNQMASSLEEKVEQIKRREHRLVGQNKELVDIKERLEGALRQMRKLDQTKSEFISVAAHQLRTPLTGIKWTLLSLTNEGAKKNGRQLTMIHKASHAVSYMLDLVNNLLNLARMEEGKIELSLSDYPLLPLLQEAMARFWIMADRKGIKLKVENLPNSEDPIVMIDKQRMRVVLDNLLDNAISYTGVGGGVSLGMVVEGQKVVVRITDTGIGIPIDNQDQIFAKFFRAANAKALHPSGSGLGMFLSRKIVQEHGGEMWFKTREGKGTSFYFSLPLAAEKVPAK